MTSHPTPPAAGELAPPRVVIENVRPQIDAGRFAVKRTVGESVVVSADVHIDGHDELGVALHYRSESQPEWKALRMEPLGNDVWRARFEIERLEPYRYTVEAWPDRFKSWRRDMQKRVAAKQLAEVDLLAGAELLEDTARRAQGGDRRLLEAESEALRGGGSGDLLERAERALEPGLLALASRYPDRHGRARYERELVVSVDRERARFSAWYELFPRSTSAEPGRHGTLRDCAKRLDYVAEMGFDVVYLPPIHPIGRVKRKGRNNATTAAEGDVGSPWAIGAKEGGHTAIHPELGTLDDFEALVTRARELGMEIALDLALQCAPDHPWVKEHPSWFRQRADGSIQYAENPPKKYEDIYPIHFEGEDWRGLWNEIHKVVMFWVERGVRVFRVDNPHTKPYPMWEWVIGEVRRAHPDVLFLAEAFTRPKVMARLAKLGFNQSYTYFAWRNTKHELVQYLTELTTTDAQEFFRPNLWPNTPDILTEQLQYGGRPVFAQRLLLAATLGASYGIYGPAYELLERRPRQPGSEEYLDSEKYEIKTWSLDARDSLKPLIARVNRVRRENKALHSNERLRFVPVDNEQLLAYTKTTPELDNIVLVVVNLDPHHVQSGWVEVPLAELGLPAGEPYQVHDLLSDARFFWSGSRNYVSLDPQAAPGHVLLVRRRVRTERDFDYYL